jgi:hypothetical protein
MSAIARETLMSLEHYARERPRFRRQVMAHKRRRALRIGEHVTLMFEDELTVRYQVQEMLRIERVFEEQGIRDELGAYNPLIPDGSNFKATMLIEFPEEQERRRRLSQLIGIEDAVWMRVAGHGAVHAIADEDLDRQNGAKTSAVHFLRFELDGAMKRSLLDGAALSAGIDHPAYEASVDPVRPDLRDALLCDLGLR